MYYMKEKEEDVLHERKRAGCITCWKRRKMYYMREKEEDVLHAG